MPFWKRNSTSKKDLVTTQGQSNLAVRTAVQPNPAADDPFRSRGDELFNQGEYNNAALMYTEALRLDGSSNAMKAPLHLQLAVAQTMCSPPQLDQALSNVNMAIQLNPSAGHAWRLKGDILERKSDYRAAEEALTHAVAISPGYEKVQAQQALANIRMRVGSTESSSTILPTTTHAPALLTQPSQPSNIAPAISAQPPLLNPPQINIQTSPSPPQTVPNRCPVPSPSPVGQVPGVGSSYLPLSTPRASTPNMMAQSEMLAEQLDIPTEAPPSYSSSRSLPRTRLGGSIFSQQQLDDCDRALAHNRQGGLYLRPLTAEGQIDTICLLFWGKTYLESIMLDYMPQAAAHRSWGKYYVDTIGHPGTNFIDYDCETAASYDGRHTGTVSVLGYSEEYREYQLTQKTQLLLYIEGQNPPRPMALDAVVQRIQVLQSNPTLEDNTRLRQILGLPHSPTLTTKIAITDICMTFHRGQYAAPSRFIDFLTTASFSRHIFGGSGIGFTSFLLHILLGAELALRLKKLGSRQKYPEVMRTTTSALVVIARQWMENVIIRKGLSGKYILTAANHAVQTEGLLRFAEADGWPYMDEARRNIEGLYIKLTSQPADVHDYLKDWLYGLVLPGKFFRQRLLSCLVLACPTTKHLSFAPNYSSGLVVGNKSYWPKRTVLGRVLGGMSNVRLTCGWVGPVPAPTGVQSSWILLHTRAVNFVPPVVDSLSETNMEILGFTEAEANRDPTVLLRDLLDMNKWSPPAGLPRRPGAEKPTAQPAVKLQAIRLNEIESASAADRQHRASLDFMCHGKNVTFTLYSNPLFVHVPRCQGGSHPIHEKLVQKLFSGIVLAKDLKNGAPIPSTETLMIIDASQPGEEVVARSWCAETGRHAVVRKDGIGCFTCATNLATKRTGLGYNVLIWC